MQPKTLQQRISIFILIPLFFILAGVGWISFIFARNAILEQWGETAVAKLQKSAHLIDMRLSRTKNLLLMLENNYSQGQSIQVQQFIIEQLKKMDGVVEVNYDLLKESRMTMHQERMHSANTVPMHMNRTGKIQLSLPQYNARLNSETISLSLLFKDTDQKKLGWIEVVISFQDLIDQISKTSWWKSNKSFIIDNDGKILTGTQEKKQVLPVEKAHKFAEADALEKETINALKKNLYGTIFTAGHPPKEISGYYHLNEAPWSLVIISPGKRVLKSILKFRLYYLIVGLFSILSVILFIRMAISGTTNAIIKVSDAAKNLAGGIFSEQLPVLSKDEVGRLTHNFNKMTRQLKERAELKEAMNLAMEVQQSLLPPMNFSYKNMEISGRSVYCDETGGDFFDIIQFPDNPGKICVAVGDVVGHGIAAALLMATTRALLRSRVMQKGSLSQIMNDVNRLLCIDSFETGSFVTLFVLMVDVDNNELQWVRAGHDPAMVCIPGKKEMAELYGEGLVLGLDRDWEYSENVYSDVPRGTLILMGTDGVWEVENKFEERFGKKRVEKLLQQSILLSSERIVNSIISEIDMFRGEIRPNDDITLLAIKFP